MGMIKLLSGLLMFALFSLAIITYSIQFGNDNNAPINLQSNSKYGTLKTSIDTDLSTFVKTANDSVGIAFETVSKSGDQNIESGGQFKTGPGEIIGTTKNILKSSSEIIFGSDPLLPIITTALFTFIAFMGGLYIWRLIKSGEPD